jgi:hypothetical protein
MASPKKSKHSHVTATTSAIEHRPPASPEHLPSGSANAEHSLPVAVTPGRSSPGTAIGKHPREVTNTVQQAPTTKPIIHITWSAWKANPTFPIRVIITHIVLGGEKNEKKPSWMLLTPVNDLQTRRYICWDRASLVKFNLSIGQICDISGLREVHAFEKVTTFLPNYESAFEYNGTLTITNQTDITAEYTPIPPLTASLIHQNAGVGRLCGVVEVMSTPTMALRKSFYTNHEDDDIPYLTFDIKLNDGTTTEAFVWGDQATSLHERSIAIHTQLLLIRAFAKPSGGLSVSPKSAENKQPMIIVLSPQQSAAQNAAIESLEFVPNIMVMKAARHHALKTRVAALQAEITAIFKEYDTITSE